MALRTVAQVLADWRDLRDNILPAMEEDGLGSQALETALTLAAPAASGGGGGPSTAITQADVLAAINAAQFNTSNNSRYELQLLSDDNGNYYSRFDKQTGTTQALTLVGANYVPVNPRLATPADRELKVSTYVAVTTSVGNWVAGEALERVQVIDTSSATPQIVSTQWFNGSGILLSSTVPSLSTDVVTASNKFSYALAQDGVEPVIARTNIATFTTSYFKINGAPHTPVRVSHISTNLYTRYEYYITTTVKSGSWSLGELITAVDTYDGSTNPSTYIGSTNFNEEGISLTITVEEFLTFSNVQKVLSSNSIAQTNLLTALNNKVPVQGQALAAASTPVVLPATQITALTPPAAITGFALDTSVNSLLKPASTLAAVTTLGSITGSLPAGTNALGSITNTAFGISGTLPAFAATPTFNLGTLNGAATAVNQASLIALFPTTLGVKASTGSLAVTLATDDVLLPLVGPVAETAPATDTASSGLNGRLQRVSQRLTSLIGLLPTSVGPKSSATSFPVVLASDDAQFGVKSTAATLPTGGTGLLGWVSDTYRLVLSAFTAASAPFTRLTDGTSTASIKAASTAPVAADTSVVVGINPNSVAFGAGVVNSTTIRTVPSQLATSFQGAVPQTVSDYALGATARLRKLKVLNENASVVYVGIYSSAAALTVASVPLNGLVWRVPANSDFLLSVGDFGDSGTFYGATTRIGVSSTRNIYTALTAPQLAASALHIETI